LHSPVRPVRLPAEIDPRALLDALRPEAEALSWSIFDLGEVVGVADGTAPPEVERMVHAVDASADGVPVSFEELIKFATWGGQIIDGVFIATRPGAGPPARADDDVTVLPACSMVVAVIDSSFWLVSAPSEVTARLRARWPAEDVAPAGVVLSVWGR
jgi:hypothetical protein